MNNFHANLNYSGRDKEKRFIKGLQKSFAKDNF